MSETTIPQQTQAVAQAVIPLIDDMVRLLTDYGIDVDQSMNGVVTWRDAQIELVFSAIVREVKQHYRHHRPAAARQEESTNAETAALQTSDIKQGGQHGAICQAAIARQEDPTDAE